MNAKQKILVARLDRLGDVLLSLPTLAYLRECFPESEIQFACRSEIQEVIRPYLETLQVEGRAASRELFQQEDVSALLALFAPRDFVYQAFRHKVPYRAGIYSRWWSFLLFNVGVRQSRSRAEKHEAEYNIELAEALVQKMTGRKVEVPSVKIVLPGDEASRRGAEEALRKIEREPKARFIIVHPGMGGSALNLSAKSYAELIRAMEEKWRLPIILSKGPSAQDERIIKEILRLVPEIKVVEGVTLCELRELFRLAERVIAPSTGPLHLAHLVGTKTIGIYSDIPSQRKERWAPFGGTAESSVFSFSARGMGTLDGVDWSRLILGKENGLRG